jgi:hypothetical protein
MEAGRGDPSVAEQYQRFQASGKAQPLNLVIIAPDGREYVNRATLDAMDRSGWLQGEAHPEQAVLKQLWNMTGKDAVQRGLEAKLDAGQTIQGTFYKVMDPVEVRDWTTHGRGLPNGSLYQYGAADSRSLGLPRNAGQVVVRIQGRAVANAQGSGSEAVLIYQADKVEVIGHVSGGGTMLAPVHAQPGPGLQKTEAPRAEPKVRMASLAGGEPMEFKQGDIVVPPAGGSDPSDASSK